jgi:transcriptional regulator with XRE-family HTH domain
MTDFEIGRIIREKRQKLGLSQLQLAKRVGVTWEMISRYERGKSSALQKILEIADSLEMEVGQFFGSQQLFGNFKDASTEYLSSRFVPIITVVPPSVVELIASISATETGARIFDDGAQIEKFGIRLNAESKLRIATSSLLRRGVLLCSLDLGDLNEQSVVLVSRNGLVSVEQYLQNDKTTILARVIEWVVKL